MDDPIPIVDAPNKPPQQFRRTRIAMAVFFGVVTVLLCLVWVRSYQQNEIYSRVSKTGRLITVGANSGSVYLVTMRHKLTPPNVGSPPYRTGFIWQTHGWRYSAGEVSQTRWLPLIESMRTGIHVSTPLWFAVSIVLAGGLLPWCTPHFSLRTMLIATTLVACVMGLVVWLAR
jgi:hypothetical protein